MLSTHDPTKLSLAVSSCETILQIEPIVPLEIFKGVSLPVVSRVDDAGSKLIWISKGSHKNRRDLRAIYRGADPQQQANIATLAEKLGLDALLAEVLSEPDEIT